MVLCIIALPVFLFLSIFSARYRPLARRAIDCVFKKVTLRKCETGLDEELKAASIAGIMKLHAPTAQFVNLHFEAFSLAFTILMLLSIIFTAQGIYNFVVYGNCNGPEGGFCIYNGLQNPIFLKPPANLQGITYGNESAKITVVEFGCYTCPYTKAAESGVQDILAKYGSQVYFVFKPFPLPKHPDSMQAAEAAYCANEEGKYWEYRKLLFENQDDLAARGDAALLDYASRLNLTNFPSCYSSGKYAAEVQKTLDEGKGCGIYGTPTIYVNGKPFVGQEAATQAEAEIVKLLGSG